MVESDDTRASARQHTARLLKMLRGYGPTAEPVPATEARPGVAAERKPGMVAEAAAAYGRLPGAMPVRQASPVPVSAAAQPAAAPPRRRAGQGSVSTVGELLGRQQGTLGELMARANRLARLSRIFRAYLPPHLHDHAVLIRLDQDGWIVHTDSASWATRLRYALHNIRETLGLQLGMPLPKPYIRVVPAALPAHSPRPPLKLTERNARLLEVAARNLSDERLSAALRRLAEHAGPARNPVENDRR